MKKFLDEASKVNDETADYAEILVESADCFHRDSTVYKMKNGKLNKCKVTEIDLDDIVLSYNPTKNEFFMDKIVFINDHSKDYGKNTKKHAVFVNIIVENKQHGIIRTQRVTSSHYTYSMQKDEDMFTLRCASDVDVGDKFLIFHQQNAIEGVVTSINNEVSSS